MTVAGELPELAETIIKHSNHGRDTITSVLGFMWQEPEWSANFLLGINVLAEKFDRLSFEIEEADISERSRKLYQGAAEILRNLMLPPGLLGKTVDHLHNQQNHIDILFMASDTLKRPSLSIPPIELRQELIKTLESAITQTKEADLDAALERLIVSHLETVLFAVRAFEHLGVEGVTRIFGAAVADVTRAAKLPEAKTGTAKQIFKATKTALAAVGGLLIFSGQAAEGAEKLISHGEGVLESLGFAVEGEGDSNGNPALPSPDN
ncbi:hypothetical protein [Altererythrobacter fulvus]|uniref:hypothetical protein n=1 Tax=Caenibius fulvus TaxID=2126012 RepID=UPI0030162719